MIMIDIPIKLNYEQSRILLLKAYKMRKQEPYIRLGQAYIYFYSKEYSSKIMFPDLFYSRDDDKVIELIHKHIIGG